MSWLDFCKLPFNEKVALLWGLTMSVESWLWSKYNYYVEPTSITAERLGDVVNVISLSNGGKMIYKSLDERNKEIKQKIKTWNKQKDLTHDKIDNIKDKIRKAQEAVRSREELKQQEISKEMEDG